MKKTSWTAIIVAVITALLCWSMAQANIDGLVGIDFSKILTVFSSLSGWLSIAISIAIGIGVSSLVEKLGKKE